MHVEAFERINKEICNTVTNHHFDVKLNTRVKCDASLLGLDASIEQDHRGNWKTVAFASKFLNIAELKYSTNELELLGLVWAIDHFKNYLLGKQFSILTDHIGALKDDKYTKTAQSRLTRWADKLIPFDFTVEHLPVKDMGFVDYLSRHPSGEPAPVKLDDKKFVTASVNQISTLLGFDHMMPRNSWSQIRDNFSQHYLAHDVTHCNTVGQSTDHMTYQEIEREKRIANAAETFQAIVNYSNISVCQNSHSRTEDCDSSCKIDFFTNFKTLKEMTEQLKPNEQTEHSITENMDTLTPSTSNPSDNPLERSPSKKKTVKINIFPFSWPEIFDSKFMSLLSKQDLVLKIIIKAVEEDRKQDILQLGNYYKSYLNNLHVSGGCLYLDNRLVIPACLRSTMLHRLHEAHPGQFAMKSLATQCIWWPKIYREIQVHGENCVECVKAGKNLKSLSNHNTLEKLPTVKVPNQEMELDVAGPLPLVWGTKIYILVCVDRFSKFPSAHRQNLS